MRYGRTKLFCGVAAIAAASPALAQEAAPAPAPTEQNGDIIVTANRTESLASKTPIALSAIGQEGLRKEGITNATTLSDAVPNLSADRTGTGLQFTIRGVTSTDTTEKGDPSVAFLLDGVYIARPQAQELSFFDLDRVEVLRGPQGTLYGRNTTAGVINVIAAKPTHEFSASIDGTYGNFNTVNATAMLNVPVNDAIALRGAFNLERRDNYIIEGVPSKSINPFKNNLSGRLSALIDISPTIDLVVRGDYSHFDGTNFFPVRLTNFFQGPLVAGQPPQYVDLGATAQRTLTYANGQDISADNNTWGVNGELNWRVGGLVVTYVGAYRELHEKDLTPFDLGLPTSSPLQFKGNYWQNSQELRVAFGKDGPFSGQAGVYYFKERSGIGAFLLNPPFIPGALAYGFPQDPTISTSKAAFGQVNYELAPGLKITAGARYSDDEKSRIGQTVAIFPAPVGTVTLQQNNAKRSFDKVTWRLGADYSVGRSLFYGSVSTGYKAGGFNDGCEVGKGASCTLTPGALYYDPETVTAYEVGLKTRFADDVVRLNLSLFHYDYKGLQLSSISNGCGGPCQITTNAGAAKIDGVEADATIRPDRSNRVDLSFNYLDARYTRFTTLGVDFAGRPLDRSPHVTATAAYTYTYPLSNGATIDAGARVRLNDAYVLTDFAAAVQFRQPSFHKSDLTLTYTAPRSRYYIQAYAKNLENAITLGTASTAYGGSATFADPRTYGVRVGSKF